MQKIHIIDSHTGGEPTRLVLDGGPDLGAGSLAEQRDIFRQQLTIFVGPLSTNRAARTCWWARCCARRTTHPASLG